jgi:hypothetical protein
MGKSKVPDLALAGVITGYGFGAEAVYNGLEVEVAEYNGFYFSCHIVTGDAPIIGRSLLLMGSEIEPLNQHTADYIADCTAPSVKVYNPDVIALAQKLDRHGIAVTVESIDRLTPEQLMTLWDTANLIKEEVK